MEESSIEMEHSGEGEGEGEELQEKRCFSLYVLGFTRFRETVTLTVPQMSQKNTNQKCI